MITAPVWEVVSGHIIGGFVRYSRGWAQTITHRGHKWRRLRAAVSVRERPGQFNNNTNNFTSKTKSGAWWKQGCRTISISTNNSPQASLGLRFLCFVLPLNTMKDLHNAHTDTTSTKVEGSSSSTAKCCKMRSEKPDINCNCRVKKEPVTGEALVALLAEADRLAREHRYEALYQLLIPHRAQDCHDVLWRLAQACCGWAKLFGEKGDHHKKKVHMEEGFVFADRALKIDNSNANCHCWYATMLHYTSESQGLKQHYLNAFVIRDHYEKAVALDPSHAVSLHSLGYWCFEFAHLPWYQKKILSLLFRTPPSTTFQQALDYFHKAEEVAPGFFSMNLVMAGRAHHSLHQYDTARECFTRALTMTPKSPDERLAHAKATEMLKKMDHHHH